MNAASSDQGAVREMASALPDAEDLLDRLAVQMACVHAAEHVENLRKSMKPRKLDRHPESPSCSMSGSDPALYYFPDISEPVDHEI